MGGFYSGRHRTQTVGAVEDACRIDIRGLRRNGLIDPGFYLGGSLGWSAGSHEVGSASFVAQMPTSKDGGFIRLAYTIEGVSYSQRIAIVALACRYGGSRYYFVCPLSGRRCEVLARVNGLWASLKAQRLAYRSQSEDQLGRLGRAARKAGARARGLTHHPKPRGENAQRLLSRWCDADDAYERAFAAWCSEAFG